MGKTEARLTCHVCDKEVNARGLKGHLRLAHGVLNMPSSTELIQEVKQKKEDSPMTDFCPECLKRDIDLKDAKRDHEFALKEAASEATRAKAELAEALKSRPSELQDIPDWDAIIKHCTDGSCPGHAKQLEDYRLSVGADVVTNLAKPENKAKLSEIAKAAGLEIQQDRITIK